jgi:hypothetical protein
MRKCATQPATSPRDKLLSTNDFQRSGRRTIAARLRKIRDLIIFRKNQAQMRNAAPSLAASYHSPFRIPTFAEPEPRTPVPWPP